MGTSDTSDTSDMSIALRDPESLARMLADAAVTALIDEVTLTPKPGLVDLRGSGAHRDLNWMLMCHSAHTLRPAFQAMAIAGATIADPQALREEIGRIGREGEAAMLQATGGINTHRGAIWALGLLVTAAAQSTDTAAAITARAARLARLRDRHSPATTGNKGEQVCRRHGVSGAKGQAQSGFPHVIDIALPQLRLSRARGDSEEAARLNALLAIIAELDDTCILSRGGPQALHAVQQGAGQVLALCGVAGATGLKALRRLEEDMLHRYVSPGGAADLLAAALFLDRVASDPGVIRVVKEHAAKHGKREVAWAPVPTLYQRHRWK